MTAAEPQGVPPERDPTDLGLSPIGPAPQLHRCTRGWQGEDTAGRPVPCPRCKPHLRRGLDERTGATTWRTRRRDTRRGA